jgi:hypothetical protein
VGQFIRIVHIIRLGPDRETHFFPQFAARCGKRCLVLLDPSAGS